MSDGLARVPPPLVVVGHTTGVPAGAPPPQEQRPYASWGDPGTLLVVTYRSSRCPQLPVSVDLEDPHTVLIRTKMYLPGGPCTRDLVPTTAVVAVPDALDESATVVVRVNDVVTELGRDPASHEPGG